MDDEKNILNYESEKLSTHRGGFLGWKKVRFLVNVWLLDVAVLFKLSQWFGGIRGLTFFVRDISVSAVICFVAGVLYLCAAALFPPKYWRGALIGAIALGVLPVVLEYVNQTRWHLW